MWLIRKYIGYTKFSLHISSYQVNINVCKLVLTLLDPLMLSFGDLYETMEKPLMLNCHTMYVSFSTMA